jgi:cysteine dioxygenase
MDPLRWKDFLDLAAAIPDEAFTEDAFFGLVRRLVIDSSLLAPYITFENDRYARNVMYRDERFEAICLCWEPGQGTAIHNHGESYGVVYVYEGTLTTTSYSRLDDGNEPGRAQLAPVANAYLPKGSLTLDRVGGIHAIANCPDSGCRAVSLHFYARPLTSMHVFDLASGTVAEKAMQGEPMAYVDPAADVMAAMI